MPSRKPSKTELQILMTNIAFGESPRWHADRLWFSDWGAQEVIAVDLEGKSEVITHVRSFPFSIDFLSDGRLLIIAKQQLLRLKPDGSLATYADLIGLSRYNWNEIVIDGRGNAYVNNIGFDFPGGDFAPGIIALVTPDGSTRQVADDLAFPNGMAVTPDNSTLIVAESYGKRLTAFDISPNGDLSKRRVWADLGDSYPDGICLDADDAIWYGDVPNKRCERVREGGEVLQTIHLDRGCFACMLGGPTMKTLFMVAGEWRGSASMAETESTRNAIEAGIPAEGRRGRTGQVLTIEAPAPGAGWP